jgi:predicted phosphodiesterase
LKFLHAADLHIDSPLAGLERLPGAPVEQIRAAPREAFRRLISLAIEEAVDFIVLSGDIFDGTWRDMSTGLFFATELRRLETLPVYIVRGNHDAESRVLKGIHLPPNVTLFGSSKPETRILEDIGVAIHGQSFASHSVPEDLAAKYPPAIVGMWNVGMLHTSLSGYAEHAVYAPTSTAVLEQKGYDYWALGHIHRRQAISVNPLIIYPGNIQGRHIQETGAKGCILVEARGTKLSHRFRPLDVIRWADLEVDVTELSSADGATALALANIQKYAETAAEGRQICYRLTFVGATKAHTDLVKHLAEVEFQLRSDAPDYDAWIAGVRARTRLAVGMDVENDPGLLGELVRAIARAPDEPLVRGDLLDHLRPLGAKIPLDIIKTYNTSFEDDESLSELLSAAKAELLARLAPS